MAPRDTALAVLALQGGGAPVEAAVTYLLGRPEESAYFGAHQALALASSGRDVAPSLAALSELSSYGGVAPFPAYHPTTYDTGLVIAALAIAEDDHLNEIAGLLDDLLPRQTSAGDWLYRPNGTGDLLFTAEILHSLAKLRRLDVSDAIMGLAVQFLLAAQLPDGSFGSPAETAVVYRALLASGVAPDDFPVGVPVPALLAAQQADGSWEGDVYTTAQVLRALRLHRPNLTISEVMAEPEFVRPGEPARLLVTIDNTGPVTAPAGTAAVYLGSLDGEELASAAVPSLPAGGSTVVEIEIDTTGREGRLDLAVLADSGDAIAEVDEDDNDATARLTLQSGPDLAVFPSDLSLAPDPPAPGESFELRFLTRNQGETILDDFAYRVARLSPGGVEELARGNGGLLAAGDTRLVSVPLSLPAGEHTLEVTLDPDLLIEEENEDDNRAVLTFFTVDSSAADLALLEGDLVLTPPAPAPGESVSVAITLRNLGQRTATTDLELFDSDFVVGDLAAGTALAAWTLEVPAGGTAEVVTETVLSADAFALVAVADRASVVAESDEGNNRLAVVFRELPNPAIGFDNLEIDPAAPLAGDPLTVTLTVRNAGTADADGVDVEVFDGDPAAGGTSIFSQRIDVLPVAANAQMSFPWTAPGGRGELVAIIDGQNALIELSELDNRAVREIVVPRSSGPDLSVGAVDRGGLTESAATLEIAGTVTVEIQNTGDADVGEPFEARLFEDRDGDGRRSAGEALLASATVSEPLAAGAAVTLPFEIDASLSFFHSLVWIDLDPGDVVEEKREDDNRVPLFALCEDEAPAGSGTIEPVAEWSLPGVEIETAPIVVQLSDDNADGRIDSRDTPDVVFHTVLPAGPGGEGGNAVMAVSGLGGETLWTFPSSPAHPLAGQVGQVAAADLDGDGIAEVIAHQRDGRLLALDHRGVVLWTSDVERHEALFDRAEMKGLRLLPVAAGG